MDKLSIILLDSNFKVQIQTTGAFSAGKPNYVAYLLQYDSPVLDKWTNIRCASGISPENALYFLNRNLEDYPL